MLQNRSLRDKDWLKDQVSWALLAKDAAVTVGEAVSRRTAGGCCCRPRLVGLYGRPGGTFNDQPLELSTDKGESDCLIKRHSIVMVESDVDTM